MINAQQLLADLTRLLKRLEDDLRQRIQDVVGLSAILKAEWQAARDADRTAETFESWADQVITQAGVHWLLSCVFLRFIEDNGLVDRPWLSGTPESGRLAVARDRHEAYFREKPLESDRDYLLASFREAAALPGLHTFFDEAHNPVFRLGLSGDAAMALRLFWQRVDPNTGTLVHDFIDADWNTRFLGDLYQDLSEATRKRYALLQTPEFVEEFILDRTLTPAIHEVGYREARMIDPTCGSGHFLLGGFRRLVDEWVRHEPARNPRDIAQRALDAVAGVDLNPFAVAISRFRLLVAALKVSNVHRLSEAPNFKFNVSVGDSLLHGTRFGMTATEGMFEGAEHYAGTGLGHAYAGEDLHALQRILGRQYHAVVGNPPYIVVKDPALNSAYRKRFASCHMKYSLGAPFTERFFDLAKTARDGQPAGFLGLITTNSFMKREFGSKLIEEVLPHLDLTHVIDTSGAYIPGHGTPTVILLGRHRAPVGESVRTVMGIKGEPSTPSDPAQGQVWRAIVGGIDRVGGESDLVSVEDTLRTTFSKHPWTIGGGGVNELKEDIDGDRAGLCSVTDSIGITSFTLEDDVFVVSPTVFSRHGVSTEYLRCMVIGEELRDWSHISGDWAFFPYDELFSPINLPILPAEHRYMWPYRTCLSNNKMFGKQTKVESGLQWWEYGRLTAHKLKTPLTITFAFVATHNHFVIDRGGKVFKQSAPVIKLPPGTSEGEHLGLLGLLNSSVACFWLQQMCHNKGRPGADTAGADERYEMRYEFDSTKVALFPLAEGRPTDIASAIDNLARGLADLRPDAILAGTTVGARPLPTRSTLDAARDETSRLRCRMISIQEELDWRCYQLYGLVPSNAGGDLESNETVEIALGERAFEIILARRVAAGKEQTTWFERHGSRPITEVPKHWPEAYRRVVQQRIELIESDKSISLIERPEFKRRWSSPKWEDLEQTALRNWLLTRLESPAFWPAGADRPPQIMTTNRLADAARHDIEFMQIATLYAGHADFDPGQIVADLVHSEAVPFLPVQRYTETGLRKRSQWEDTWALQRREDAGETVGKIPVPPKYQSKDFLKTEFWRLRGGLDAHKERWVSYPGCERGADASLPIVWAGWNHLRRATALATYYVEMKDTEGWETIRLQPLLAGLLELLPWLEQWHNEIDPVFGERMGVYYRGFVSDEARAMGLTLDDLRRWKPAALAAKRGRKKAPAAL